MSAAPPIPNTQPEEDTAAVREEQLEHAKRRQEELEVGSAG